MPKKPWMLRLSGCSQMHPWSNFKNLYQVLENTVAQFADQPAYFTKQAVPEQQGQAEPQWQPISWKNYKNQIDDFAMALLSRSFAKGDTICILAGNCLAWPIADMGTIAAGGIGIGLYPSSSAEQCAYILNHSQSQYILVDSAQQLDKILSIKNQTTHLRQIITTFEHHSNDAQVLSWEAFLSTSQAYRQQYYATYQEIAHAAEYEDIAIIVYTSGTTGNPKGACLSHRYVIASIQALEHFLHSVRDSLSVKQQADLQDQQFISLSFLPFCHVAERISGMYTRLYTGDAAYLVEDFSQLNQSLAAANPHGFGGLPRIYEKIYAQIMSQVETRQGFDKEVFLAAIEVNKKIKSLQLLDKKLPKKLLQQFNQAEENIYAKVRSFFGKRILFCSSGAAPLPEKVLEMFEYAGNIHILEAYGLTEFVCCAFNIPQAHRANSVGKPMLGCEIKIQADGEILLKGPQMFSGYYQDERATKEAIDTDGWLHTGDIGRLDNEGFLYITGRKKEFIKTSTGKKISPLAIENLCKRNHLISNVMVYGDNKKYLSALISLNAAELVAYAEQQHFHYEQNADLSQHAGIKVLVQSLIDEVNQRVSSTEQIRKYIILEQDFSIERNEITPTGKLKRQQVAKSYAALFESMYSPD